MDQIIFEKSYPIRPLYSGFDPSRDIIQRSVEQNLPSSLESKSAHVQPMDVFEFTDFEAENRLRKTVSGPISSAGSRAHRVNPIPAGGQKNSHKLKIKLKYKRNLISHI